LSSPHADEIRTSVGQYTSITIGILASPDRGVREAVLETLLLIELEPEAMGKQLVGGMKGLWSARVGHYRVLYTIERSGVIVREIQHRAVVYRSSPK
jgi:mRNA-degrading endonuclease RelE of RelBE toxin-antitoxin system